MTDLLSQGLMGALGFPGANAAAQKSQIDAETTKGVADRQNQGTVDRENIDEQYGQQGMYQSGRHLRDLSRSTGGEQSDIGSIQGKGAFDIAQGQSSLYQEWARQQAEAESLAQQRRLFDAHEQAIGDTGLPDENVLNRWLVGGSQGPGQGARDAGRALDDATKKKPNWIDRIMGQ